MQRRSFATLLVVSVGIVAGCGPSFQAIYEGNVRFEHCYALEESPQVSMPERADCWRDWSEHYTFGQTRDRIQYATARYVALSQAPNMPTDEAMMMAAPGVTPRVTTIAAPAPTNAFAPPPKVLDEDGGTVRRRPSEGIRRLGPEGDSGAPSGPPPLPASACTDSCGRDYRECDGICDEWRADAGAVAPKKAKVCQGCGPAYKACVRECLK